MQLSKRERRNWEARAIAVGLPKDSSQADIVAAEAEKNITPNVDENETVKSNENEEDTAKIFNLSTGTPSDKKQAENKKVITDPIKAWGKPR